MAKLTKEKLDKIVAIYKTGGQQLRDFTKECKQYTRAQKRQIVKALRESGVLRVDIVRALLCA